MSNKTYYEKLKDPRWQKKRLEVLNDADFTCLYCYSSDDTLNIHHVYYEKGLDPWDYDNSALWVLCESCHKEVAKLQKEMMIQLSFSHPHFFPFDFFERFYNLFDPRLNKSEILECLIELVVNSPLYNQSETKIFTSDITKVFDKHRKLFINTGKNVVSNG